MDSNQTSSKGINGGVDSPAKRRKEKISSVVMPTTFHKNYNPLYNKLKIPVNIPNLISFQPIPMIRPDTSSHMNKGAGIDKTDH